MKLKELIHHVYAARALETQLEQHYHSEILNHCIGISGPGVLHITTYEDGILKLRNWVEKCVQWRRKIIKERNASCTPEQLEEIKGLLDALDECRAVLVEGDDVSDQGS